MAKNCLVYETLNAVNEMKRESSGDGLMHLRGTFGVCGVKNNNQRIYEAGNYGKMVAEMKKRLAVNPILGELEHPSTMNITLENVSHKITDINIDENGVVSGEIVLLNTPKGKIAQEIVEGGAPLFISSRAQGMVDPRTSVVTLENLATYDLVGSPGFSQAELHLNEGQVAEAICESVGYVYEKSENENHENDMEAKEILEKLEALDGRVKDLEAKNEALEAKNAELEAANNTLKEQIESAGSFTQEKQKKLCDSIQRWVLEQYSPEMQRYLVEQFAPEIQKWMINEVAPEIQAWILEDYSPDVQNWCQTEFATGIQSWFVDEAAPEMEAWITENYGATVANQITEAIKEGKKNSLSNIEQTLTMLESIQQVKPVYKGQAQAQQQQTTLIKEDGAPRYISEMPAESRVKYDLASPEIKEAIDRRAKLFDFNKHSILEFWAGVNWETIKPVTTIQESLSGIQNERERSIRAQLMSWHSRHYNQ